VVQLSLREQVREARRGNPWFASSLRFSP